MLQFCNAKNLFLTDQPILNQCAVFGNEHRLAVLKDIGLKMYVSFQ